MTVEEEQYQVQKTNLRDASETLETQDQKQRRQKIVRHLMEHTSNGTYLQIDETTTQLIMGVMTNFAIAIEESLEKFGGKNRATTLQVLSDLGNESKDPTSPLRTTIAALNSVEIQKKAYTPIHAKKFAKRYIMMYAGGVTSLNDLKFSHHIASKTGLHIY